jgi:hypothetical protein
VIRSSGLAILMAWRIDQSVPVCSHRISIKKWHR